jgi:hypothetical protein
MTQNIAKSAKYIITFTKGQLLKLVDSEGIYSYRIVYIALVTAVGSSLSATCGWSCLRPAPWFCTRGFVRGPPTYFREPGLLQSRGQARQTTTAPPELTSAGLFSEAHPESE